MIVDTHTHLYLPQFQSENDEVVCRAINAGVERLIFPNVDLETIEPMRALHSRFSQNSFLAMGLHPTEIGEEWEKDYETILDEFEKHPEDYIAVGEIGMDLYWEKDFIDQQREAFSRQLDLASALNLPVIIHSRDALKETLDIMRDNNPRSGGVFHSFGGTKEDVKKIKDAGDYYFGINGIVTFKNSGLKDVLPTIGIDRIVLETDAPYLAPVPNRGKRNESSYIVHVASALAEVFSLSYEEVCERTTKNAFRLFRRMQ